MEDNETPSLEFDKQNVIRGSFKQALYGCQPSIETRQMVSTDDEVESPVSIPKSRERPEILLQKLPPIFSEKIKVSSSLNLRQNNAYAIKAL